MQATAEGAHNGLHVTLCSVYCNCVSNVMYYPIIGMQATAKGATMVYMLHCAQFIVIVYLM